MKYSACTHRGERERVNKSSSMCLGRVFVSSSLIGRRLHLFLLCLSAAFRWEGEASSRRLISWGAQQSMFLWGPNAAESSHRNETEQLFSLLPATRTLTLVPHYFRFLQFYGFISVRELRRRILRICVFGLFSHLSSAQLVAAAAAWDRDVDGSSLHPISPPRSTLPDYTNAAFETCHTVMDHRGDRPFTALWFCHQSQPPQPKSFHELLVENAWTHFWRLKFVYMLKLVSVFQFVCFFFSFLTLKVTWRFFWNSVFW